MPKKMTYSEVKMYIEDNGGNACELLSIEYINSETPLKLRCKCGEVFYRTFHKLRMGRFFCDKCARAIGIDKITMPMERVKQIISENGCEYISGEYQNSKSKLLLKCKCGNTFLKDMSHFIRGQTRCPNCGKESSRRSKFKYDIEKVKEILAKDGYAVLQDNYVDCETPILCKCSKGHICKIKFVHYLNNHSGCKKCANLALKGEQHWNYKGGESEVIDHLRKVIKSWKYNVFNKYHGKCYLTGANRDIVAHHLIAFNTIVKESCKELNIPLHNKIKEYTEEEFAKLEQLVLEKHKPENGIALQRKVHNKFHSIYGKGDNTIEQFNEFIEQYYPQKQRL